MATFWEIAAHSVDHYVLFVILVISQFGFEGWIWVLIALGPDLCILFTSSLSSIMSGTVPGRARLSTNDPIRITCPCNEDPLTPHFYIVKLGFTGVYFIFLFLL